MIEGLVTRILNRYLIDYLDNFNKDQLSISLLKGKIELEKLQLNSKILDNIGFPLNMKYGRIGKIQIILPPLLQITSGKFKIHISDVFIPRPMSEWKEDLIMKEFQTSKEKTLDAYEEDAKFFYIEKKGDEEEMNKFVLQIIQNLEISIENVFIRLEDPSYPFCLGVLLPSIQVQTRDQHWQSVKHIEEPEIAYKSIQIKDCSIFMETDSKNSSIDEIIQLQLLKDHSDDWEGD